MQLNTMQLDWLARLGKSPDGQLLRGLLTAEVSESNSALRKLTGDLLVREQGKALFIDRLLDVLDPKPKPPPRQLKPFSGASDLTA